MRTDEPMLEVVVLDFASVRLVAAVVAAVIAAADVIAAGSAVVVGEC